MDYLLRLYDPLIWHGVLMFYWIIFRYNSIMWLCPLLPPRLHLTLHKAPHQFFASNLFYLNCNATNYILFTSSFIKQTVVVSYFLSIGKTHLFHPKGCLSSSVDNSEGACRLWYTWSLDVISWWTIALIRSDIYITLPFTLGLWFLSLTSKMFT